MINIDIFMANEYFNFAVCGKGSKNKSRQLLKVLFENLTNGSN